MKNKIKLVRVEKSDWEWLQKIKLKHNYNNLTEIITLLITHSKEAIKQGHLQLK